MPIRPTISHLPRLSLLLACWLGGVVCSASPWAPPQTLGVRPAIRPAPALLALHEQAALLPAVPQVPGSLTPDAVPTTWPTWLGSAQAAPIRPLSAVCSCTLPNVFRVRLLLTEVAPNAP